MPIKFPTDQKLPDTQLDISTLAFRTTGRGNLLAINRSNQNSTISTPAIEEVVDSFPGTQDGTFVIERDSATPPPFPLSVNSLSTRKWDLVPVVILR